MGPNAQTPARMGGAAQALTGEVLFKGDEPSPILGVPPGFGSLCTKIIHYFLCTKIIHYIQTARKNSSTLRMLHMRNAAAENTGQRERRH